MKRSFWILILSLCVGFVSAQVDTEFWFACPDLSAQHFESCIRLCITTFDQPTVVTISQPANASFAPIQRTIVANSYENISLSSLLSQVETKSGAVRKTGLLIQSTSKITAYYANYCDNSEIYSLKGRNALGTDFIVPTQYTYENSEHYGGSSSIEIVATQDDTEVQITPSHACVGHPANQTFTIRLNRGETFSCKAKSMTPLGHLFNTRIVSSRPIAVNYTDDSVSGPGTDLIGDQIVPTSLAGSQYVAVRYAGQVEEVYFFPATSDSTQLYANGTLIATLPGHTSVTQAGKARFILPTGATFFSADHPIIALQVTSNGTELGSAILPPIVCTGSDEIAYKYTQTSGAAISLVTKTENIDAFTVNGQAYLMPPEYFSPVPGAPQWSYTFKPAPATGGTLRVKNSKGIFHMAVIDNPGTTCSLGYFSNFNQVPLGVGTDKAYYLEGQTLQLSIQNSEEFTNIHWTGPDGFSSSEVSPIIENVSEINAGTYVVSADHIEGCETVPDTIRVSIFRPRMHSISACYGNTVDLTAEGVGPYQWTPNNLPVTKTVQITATQDATYWAESYKLGTNRVTSKNFEVSTCTTGTPIWEQTIPNVTTTARNALSGTFYAQTEQTVPTLRYKINGEWVGDPFTPTVDGAEIQYEWTNVADIAHISIETIAAEDSASVVVRDLSFAPVYAITDTFALTVRDSLSPVIRGDQYICSSNAHMYVEGNYDSYLWSNGATTNATQYHTAGPIWVRVTQDDCSGSGYATLENPASLTFELDSLPKICHGDSLVVCSYHLNSGDVSSYDLLFDDKAHTQGFEDQYQQIPNGSHFVIPIPDTAAADVYTGRLCFLDPICNDTATLPLLIPICYAHSIVQRWNDVLSVTNENYNDGAHRFTAYQWYKNGQPLEGQIGSYLYLTSDTLSALDTYSVLLTNEEGVSLFTCDYTPFIDPLAHLPIELLGSSQVAKHSAIQLKNCLGGVATFYDMWGREVSTFALSEGVTTLVSPSCSGLYILWIQDAAECKPLKIIVH